MRHYIKLLIALLFYTNTYSQGIKLKQIEPCYDPVTHVRMDSCMTLTDANGYQYYVDLATLQSIFGGDVTSSKICAALSTLSNTSYVPNDYFLAKNTNGTCKLVNPTTVPPSGSALCTALKTFTASNFSNSAYAFVEMPDGSCKKILLDSILSHYNNKFNCDSVAYCLLNDGRLCDALNAYGTTNYIPQYIIGVDNGNCFRVDGNLFGGGTNFNCDSVEQCLSGNPFFCDLVDSCLMNSSNLCNLIDSCLSNSDTLCDLVQSCFDSISFDSLVCVGLEGIAGSNYVDGDSAIITRGGQCFKIPWYCCDTTGGQALQAGDCIDIVGDTVINVKVDPMSDNLLQCTANGLYVDPNTTCSNYQVQDIDANYQWVVYNPAGNDCYRAPINLNGDNCIGLNITTGALNAFMKISSDAGNTVECRANGIYAGGCNYSNSGQLTNGDLVVVQTANGCVTKTMTSEVCSLPNGGFGNTGCVEVLTRVGGVCQFRNYQLSACPPPDVPFAAMSTNKALEDKIKALELQNKLLEKRLAKLEKLIK